MNTSKFNVIVNLDAYPDLAILQNLFHGGTSLIPRNLGERLLSSNEADWLLSESETATLKDRYFVFDNNDDERALHRELSSLLTNALRSGNPSKKYQILLSYNCNLRCSYCFQKDSRALGTMSEKKLSDILSTILDFEKRSDDVADHADQQKPQIAIVGGEPLLPAVRHHNLVAQILKFCGDNNFDYTITTNGTGLGSFVDDFRRTSCFPRNVQVTLDGVRDVHDRRRPYASGKGSFDVIATNVSAALAAGIHVSIRVNVDHMNVEDVIPLADLFHANGWASRPNFSAYLAPVTDHSGVNGTYPWIDNSVAVLRRILQLFTAYPMLESTYTMKNFRAFDYVRRTVEGKQRPAPTMWRCEAVLGQLVFDPDGNVFSCFEGAGDPQALIGHIDKMLVIDVVKQRQWSTLNMNNDDTCRDCLYRFICATGCPWHMVRWGEPECLPIRDELHIAWNHFADRQVRARAA